MRPWHLHLRAALFTPMLLTSRCLSARGQRRIERLTARFVYVLAPRLRRRLEKNLGRALGGSVPPARLRTAVRNTMANYGRYLHDFLGLRGSRGGELLRSRIGVERLREAAASGRGVVLATAHLGSWEMAARFLADEAARATLVSVPEEIGYLGDLRSSIRSRQDHEEVLVRGDPMAALDLLAKLRAGGLVGMQLDRATGDAWVAVPFLGGRLKMPVGPIRLARLAGASIVPAFALFSGESGYDLVIEEPIDASTLGEDLLRARLAGLLERYVRANAEQWLMMADPWADD